jgi:hypothetical protein
MWAGHPLAGECLEVFDGMLRSIVQELAHDLDTLVVRDMNGWFAVQ